VPAAYRRGAVQRGWTLFAADYKIRSSEVVRLIAGFAASAWM